MSNIVKFYSDSHFLQWLFRESVLSKALHRLLQYYRFFEYKYIAYKDNRARDFRKKGGADTRFSELRSLHMRYKGKRCFITCTGPSLTVQDLELLKDEYVFGMNSICLIHDQTSWKPDFYGIEDIFVFEKLKEKLLNTDNGQIFAPLEFKESYNTPGNWVYFHTSWAYHMYDRKYRNKFYCRFSDDCYATVYDGYTITYSILQLAVYLGFDEIYLLGADCSYLGNKQHFIDHGHATDYQSALNATDRLMVSYAEAKKYADCHGVKIFNATRGGLLELFPRVELETVLKKNEKNKLS